MNRIAPTAKLTIKNVESAWAGIRPLIQKKGKAPSELSRKDEIFYSDSGLISIAGGKLTGYRIMAKKIVDIVAKQLQKTESRKFKKCRTHKIPLSGGNFNFEPSLNNLVEYMDIKFDEAKQTGISVENFKALFFRYGSNIDIITEKAYFFFNKLRNTEKAWQKAEIWYSINHEMACCPADFFIRRTDLLHFNIKEILPTLDNVADDFAEILNITSEQKEKYKQKLLEEYDSATKF